jgi:membrane protease YdiL (CAAX protease family)
MISTKEISAEVKLYFERTGEMFNSVVMIAPLLVLYELGLFFVDVNGINGVDFLTFALCRLGKIWFIVFNAVVLAFFILSVILLSKKNRFHVNYFFPAIVESSVYAICTWFLIVIALNNTGIQSAALPAATRNVHNLPLVSIGILSFGAGIFEETFFRLCVFGGLYWIMVKKYNVEKFPAFMVACLVSSVFFSIAHFFGQQDLGTAREFIFAFLWRFLAGFLLVLIFHFRSFAIAVYTHALYNIFVLTSVR